ncbi:MAG: sn-glycerol-3-phosphate transporter ATP-binding protein UgpC [Actinomycetota bacterium]|jgi:multiple sugar transport system ATP-binding protein
MEDSECYHNMRLVTGEADLGNNLRWHITQGGSFMGSIVLNEVDKVYENGFHAVTKLSLDVADGEFLVLVGPSGCGKSTALRMIAGLESITSGEMSIGGTVVNDLEPKDRDIAMVFQSYALYPHLTVRDNIAFALKLRKMPKDEITQRVDEAARILELTENLDRRPGQLSGGQRQRVAMGRAIVRQPQAFLMDEPLSNLDAKLRVQMRAEISRLQHSLNVTTVYVTHDQIEAMTMGDRVAVMSRGELQQVDSPQNLYDAPRNLFVAAFIGSPQMNLLHAQLTLTSSGASVRVGSHDLSVPQSVLDARPSLAGYDGRSVAIGIRPEHLTVASDGTPDSISGQVEIREGLGSEVILHLSTDTQGVDTSAAENPTAGSNRTLVARLEPHTKVVPGDHTSLAVQTASMHLFDLETGLAIN